jgi:hypothetical protein
MSEIKEVIGNLYDAVKNLIEVAGHHKDALEAINKNTVQLDGALKMLIEHCSNMTKMIKGHEARIGLLEHQLKVNETKSVN